MCRPMSRAAAAAIACGLFAAACTGPGASAHRAAPRKAPAPRPSAAPAQQLEVLPAPYQLPAAISREVALPVGNELLIAGGLTARGASTNLVTSLDPVTGRAEGTGKLADATHDAAGAVVGGNAYLFGGSGPAGDNSVATIQSVADRTGRALPGGIPTPRSDANAVTAGAHAYIVGGYDGTVLNPAVLSTTDGHRFGVAARLPVPVRYAAVAVAGGQLWVFGGKTAAGSPTDVIQRIDLAAGRARVAGHLPQPLEGAAAVSLGGQVYLAGGATGGGTSDLVYQFDPATAAITRAGTLPVPVGYGAAAVIGGIGYLIGGEDGSRTVPTVTVLRLVPAGTALPGAAPAPWLAPPPAGPGHLAAGSDPSALPADVLIADHLNNRLVIVDPQGRIRWQYPQQGDLGRGQTFLVPDDAFFSPDGKNIIATQEDDQVVSVISVATRKIVYRYGVPGVSGAGPGHLSNPDDAMLTPAGDIIVADIKNCRILLIKPPAHVPAKVIGQTRQDCAHQPPARFGSPNGAFPLTDSSYLVTEINGDWVDQMSLHGQVAWSASPPGVLYPSDTNEVYPGRYLTADYSTAGQVVEFDSRGHVLWRHGGFNKPSLALPLPNGDVLLNDDFNHRVCVLDPATGRIVWQYGHTGVSGHAPGFLDDPDGVDLVPPSALLVTHAQVMGEP